MGRWTPEKRSVLETLEARSLLSATPLAFAEASYLGGTQFRLTGTDGADVITVTRDQAGGMLVSNDSGWNQTFSSNFKSLRIDAGPGNDTITLDAGLELDAILFGGAGNDILNGGAGNDRLYGGQGSNTLAGGPGDDVLVTIGGSKTDQIAGNDGRDSFWIDGSDSEIVTDLSSEEAAAGSLHRVSEFWKPKSSNNSSSGEDVDGKKLSREERIARREARKLARQKARQERADRRIARKTLKVAAKEGLAVIPPQMAAIEPANPMDLLGQDQRDPAAMALIASSVQWTDYSDHELFGNAGPSPDDVRQGGVGDCYFLSVLSSVAKIDPVRIREHIVDLGDGTYCVQLEKAGSIAFVRVDGQLPQLSGSDYLPYANLGAQGSLWVALMEKAYAMYRTGEATYQSAESGWMIESYAALGATSQSTFEAASPGILLQQIRNELEAGKSVTYAVGTPAPGSNLAGYHAYMVDAIITNSAGVPTHIRLRNPWGSDGYAPPADGVNDGYITINAQTAHESFLGFVSAVV